MPKPASVSKSCKPNDMKEILNIGEFITQEERPDLSRGSRKIGHGNPPQHTQFAKGRSGNPKGRPKGSKNVSTIIMEAARDQVSATIDGKKRKITKLQATAMQMATLAASGKPQMVAKFLDWVDEIEKTRRSREASGIPYRRSRPRSHPCGPRPHEALQTQGELT